MRARRARQSPFRGACGARRDRGGGASAGRGRRLLLLRRRTLVQPVEDVEEERHVQHRERRLAEHPAEDAGADRVARVRAGADRDRERQHAERERERGHDDRPQPLLAGLDRRLHDRLALLAQLHRGGDAQHGVLRAEPDQHQQADLEVDVVLQAAQPDRGQRAEDPERHRRHHRTRQGPRLVLGGEHQEDDDQAEHERDHRRPARLLLLEREARPGERVALRQHLARDLLHRRDRLARAVAGRRVAVDLRRREAVEVRQQVGAGDPARRDERRERHHLCLAGLALGLVLGLVLRGSPCSSACRGA